MYSEKKQLKKEDQRNDSNVMNELYRIIIKALHRTFIVGPGQKERIQW